LDDESDKGGDLCVIKQIDYEKAISEHLCNNPIYRKVNVSKIESLENRINDEWKKVCHENKIPKRIQNMYSLSCSNFATIQAVIKTHKPMNEAVPIRPIINSIGSPGYNLSKFFQEIMQPLAYNLTSSDLIMNEIKSINQDVLKENKFPVSLDVENMYHNIPRELALNHLREKMESTPINTCSIRIEDIVHLVGTCLSCNHFKHNGLIFFQKQGLPMGNRLSGILADLFIDKIVRETYVLLNFHRPTYRYVDDLLILTKGEIDAQQIFLAFNNNHYGIKFTLELPVNNEIAYLDFKIHITDEGEPKFDFYRKEARKDNFVNAKTALPQGTIKNIAAAEWTRIHNRCSHNDNLAKHKLDFLNRLRKNGHQPNILRSRGSNTVANNSSEPTFFLSIPYVNDEIEYKVKNSLKGLGVKIQIAHKGKKLRHMMTQRKDEMKCNMKGCKLQNKLCYVRGAVYEIKCDQCGNSYVGSTWRYLHTRFKEHLNQKASPIYLHNQRCNGLLKVKLLDTDENIQRMRIKEAIIIKQQKPTLNVKDDLFRSHILFD
jgi:hypothetical protein